MFESIERRKVSARRRITTLLVSAFLHTTIILVLVVLPLVYYNILPQQEILTYLMIAPPPPPPPPAPPPPPPARKPMLPQPQREVASGFIAPTEIPKTIPPPTDEPVVADIPRVADSALGGIPGGVIGGALPTGIQGMLLGPTPPPPPLPPPPMELPKPRAPLAVSNLQQQSKLIRMIQPVYPPLARNARVQGVVLLHIVVDEGGNVSEADVLSGHPLLDDAAVAAVKQWKYSPTILNGSPIQVSTTVNVIFTLSSP